MGNKQEMKITLCPLILFPEEIWEKVLGQLENSQDILNTFQAYPVLEGQVLKHKYWWLIDQVFPLIKPWLPVKDMLSCRQVCKRWHQGLDADLEKYFIKVPIILDSVEKLQKCILNADNYPSARYPFAGRSIKIDEPHMNGNGVGALPASFWNEALQFIRINGEHIWFLSVWSNYIRDGKEFKGYILEYLKSPPNLRSLSLPKSLRDESEQAKHFLEKREWSIPPLPQLEDLELLYDTVSQTLVKNMLSCYSPQLKRLGTHTHYWGEGYPTSFPRLEEFELYRCRRIGETSRVLYSLQAANLRKLKLDLELMLEGTGDLGNKIPTWLKGFPKINSLELGLYAITTSHERGQRRWTPPPQMSAVLTLRSLTVEGWIMDMHFDFLKCYPSLEHVTIKASTEMPEYFQRENLYDLSYIWETLPKLKQLRLYSHQHGHKNFTRERYEWLLKMKEIGSMRVDSAHLAELDEFGEQVDIT